MIPSDFRGAARTISDAGPWLDAAEALDCDVAAIRAVAEVESRGAAFLASGRPPILFERHVFHRLTAGRWSSTYPAISNPAAGGYGAAGDAQYARLRAAMDLDRAAALEAASWGRWQVMGFNARLCGWASVEAFVAAMCAGEAQQLDAFVGYVRGA
ncbi:MAG: N-acetylmuramidase family protein, partial [Pseudomonadota bacterium]|nr:N-acetylmuramidase family protein [Pseudomonadota bacterium]